MNYESIVRCSFDECDVTVRGFYHSFMYEVRVLCKRCKGDVGDGCSYENCFEVRASRYEQYFYYTLTLAVVKSHTSKSDYFQFKGISPKLSGKVCLPTGYPIKICSLRLATI